MNKERAKELKEFAQTIADRFSNFNRSGNQNNETFSVDEVIPISDDSAVINFKKSTNKIAVAFCYYINKPFKFETANRGATFLFRHKRGLLELKTARRSQSVVCRILILDGNALAIVQLTVGEVPFVV